MSPARVTGTTRDYPRPGAIGGDPASRMARPAVASTAPGTNQRTTVSAVGATAGSFTLRIRFRGDNINVVTAAINFNDPLATLVSKMDAALPGSGHVVGVSGGPLPAASVVEFASDLASQDVTISVNSQGLTGGTASVSTSRAAAAGAVLPRKPGLPTVLNGMGGSLMSRPQGLGR